MLQYDLADAARQFAFYSIDIHDALREVSGANILPLQGKVENPALELEVRQADKV